MYLTYLFESISAYETHILANLKKWSSLIVQQLRLRKIFLLFKLPQCAAGPTKNDLFDSVISHNHRFQKK